MAGVDGVSLFGRIEGRSVRIARGGDWVPALLAGRTPQKRLSSLEGVIGSPADQGSLYPPMRSRKTAQVARGSSWGGLCWPKQTGEIGLDC